MKTTNKICGIVAASVAALLVTAALITSCLEPLVESPYQPPEGKGAIFLKLGDGSAARTILPDTPDLTRYNLSFQGYDDNVGTNPVGSPIVQNVVATSISTPIILSPGFYKVTVIGQTDDGETPPVYTNAAIGESAVFTITAGFNTNVTVNISPYAWDVGSGNGTLTHTITLGSGVTIPSSSNATRTLTPLIGGSTYANPGSAIPITPGSKQSIPLPSGFYTITITVPTANGSASFNELLQIYQGLTTTFDYEFISALYPAGGTGTINPPYQPPVDNKPTLSDGTSSIAEGATITLSKNIAGTPPTPQTVTITITNNTPAFQNYKWMNSSGTFTTDSNASITITAGTAPFIANNTYEVTAIGYNTTPDTDITIGAWSTKFNVVITD